MIGNVVLALPDDDTGMTGNTSADGCWASCRTVWWATCVAVLSPSQDPVLGFGSNCGKSLDEISTRIRWPARNRLLVGHTVIVYW